MNDTLKRLYDRNAPALRLYARTWCRHPDDALQEAMIEIAKQAELPAEPVAWLYRAVKFRALNLQRGDQRREARERIAADQRAPFFIQDPSADIDAAVLESALQQLSEQKREIVVARIWGQLSLEQVADLTNLSTSTVHRHYHASLNELKHLLENSNSTLLQPRHQS